MTTHLNSIAVCLVGCSLSWGANRLPDSLCATYSTASQIFVGTVLQQEESTTARPKEFRARFRVIERLKGAQTDTADILVTEKYGGIDCGVPELRRDTPYIVIGFLDDHDQTRAFGCSTLPTTYDSMADLKLFRSLLEDRVPSLPYLVGSISPLYDYRDRGDEYKFLPGIRVIAASKDGSKTTETDEHGVFEFPGLSPGSYTLSVEPSSGVGEDGPKTVTIASGTCNKINFLTWWKGEIAGRIRDYKGDAVTNGQLSLIDADGNREIDQADLDESGKFAFTDLSPGKYKIAFNNRWVIDSDSPHPPAFYPGVNASSRAQTIEIDRGQQVLDVDFRLPYVRKRRLIGQVLWPSARPAPNAQVYVEYEHSLYWNGPYYHSFGVDPDGTTSIEVYGDGKIRFHAMATDKSGKKFFSAPVFVDLKNLPGFTKLVLTLDHPPASK